MKKIFGFFFTFIILISNISYADDLFAQDDLEDYDFTETSNSSTSDPITNSKNIIVVDRKTLSTLYEKNAYEKVPMASTTKIMTCIIALENANLTDITTISKKAASVSGSTLGLIKNMKISINDLLYGLMLRSGNDCAIAIAEYISGNVEDFAFLMNQKAKELGLKDTNFVTPHGLDNPNHYTTAYDLAILTDYALNNSKFREIVGTKTCSISFNGYSKSISNTNELLGRVNGVYGVKTGFTFEAGRCLVSACKRDNLDIIVVVLGADTKNFRTKDSSELINYIYNNFKYVDISSSINHAFSDYISYFNSNYHLEKTTTKPILSLETLDNYEFPLSINTAIKLNTKIYTINNFNPKVEKNSTVGSLCLYNDDKLLCTAKITIKNDLVKNDWKYYFRNILESFKF